MANCFFPLLWATAGEMFCVQLELSHNVPLQREQQHTTAEAMKISECAEKALNCRICRQEGLIMRTYVYNSMKDHLL